MIKFKKGLNKTKIILSFSTHMVTDTYASFIVGFIPILAVKLELSLFLVSILTSVNFISNSLTQPAFGYLSDKYGIRYFMIAGPLFASIFISILGVSPNYWSILIFLFLGNLGVAAIHPPTAATASHAGGSRKGFINSIISFGGTVGFSAGSLFVILIINKLGLKFTPLAAIPGIIMALILMKFDPSIFLTKTQKVKTSFIRKTKSLKKTKLILLLLLMFASYSRDLTVLSMLTFMPLYFTNQGVKLINFGYIILVFILIGGIGGLFAGYYSDKIRKRTVVIQAGLVISVPLFFLMFKVPLSMSIILFILAGFFTTSTLPLCIRVAQDIFPGNVSLASSIVMGVSGGIAAATVILVGKIADNIGMVRTINYVLIIPILASMLLFLFPHVRSKYR
ncbi:MAG: MFS transporter [Actinobacteria bacterium]|nr:MFS transporter [Actinomycetota bacterium]MBE3113982.1 MFS transporter [Actinomycetota bacterium]